MSQYAYRISINTSHGYYFFVHYGAAGKIQGREQIEGGTISLARYIIYAHAHIANSKHSQELLA